MDTTFQASELGTLGVEWELQLVDAETRHLCNDAAAVLESLPGSDADGVRRYVKHEFMQHTVEIVTGVCRDVAEVKADLAGTVAQVAKVAEARGLALACAGSHPISDWRSATIAPGERYAELLERCQWPARRIQTFGVHVHVGVASGDLAVAVVNGLSAYIAHMLALTASSPYWSGEDTGLASSRAVVFGVLPTAGQPMPVQTWADFERYLRTMERAGTISAIKDVWWDIRPQPALGTVENRISDGIPTLREVGMVTALTQCLTDELVEAVQAGRSVPTPDPWVVRENKWRAGRYGLDTDVLVDNDGNTRRLADDLSSLVDRLTPRAQRLGCDDDLAVVADVLAHGASYRRQRAVVDQGGSTEDVVDLLLAEMRENRIG